MGEIESSKVTSNGMKNLVLGGLAAMLVIIGFILTPSLSDMGSGLMAIMKHHGLLDSDLLVIGGSLGPAFVNSGLLGLCALLVYKLVNAEIEGPQMAAFFMVIGYSFYGKTLFNAWPLVIGVFLEAKVNKKSLTAAAPLAWYTTALGGIVSVLAFHTPVIGVGTPLSIAIAIGFGLLAGYLTGFLAGHIATLHKGMILYNAGFTVGIVGFIINSILKAIGLGHGAYTDGVYTSGMNTLFASILSIAFLYLIIVGLIENKGLGNYKEMFMKKYKSGNFVTQFGFGTTLINMGVLGLITLAYVLVVGGQLSGPSMIGLWTVVAFAAVGVTIPGFLPILFGIFAGALITGGMLGVTEGQAFMEAGLLRVASRPMLIAAGLSCGLSPITSEYGPVSGFMAGVLHVILVPNVSVLHGWMSTYNNGFSMGLMVIFFLPIFERIGRKFGNKEAVN